eukprot:352977_1
MVFACKRLSNYCPKMKQREQTNGNKSFKLLHKSMDCLFNYFLRHNIKEYSNLIDIFIFHTGDFTENEHQYITSKYRKYSINIYSLNINDSNNKYWGIVPTIKNANK